MFVWFYKTNYNLIKIKTFKKEKIYYYCNMTILFKRKVLQVGDSLGITIPEEMVQTHKIKKGQEVYIMTDAIEEEGFIVVDLLNRSRDEIWKLLKE